MPISNGEGARDREPAERTRASEAPVRRLVVHNEFAVVAVELLGGPGRERLSIADLRTNEAIELDALELESLAWSSHEDLERLLDPSRTRWVGAG